MEQANKIDAQDALMNVSLTNIEWQKNAPVCSCNRMRVLYICLNKSCH